MIRAFLGDDSVAVRAKAHAFLDKEGAEGAERVTAETYVPGMLLAYAGTQELFGPSAPMILDGLDEDGDTQEELLASLEALAESPRLFVLIGHAPNAEAKKAFARAGIEVSAIAAAERDTRFNTFLLADALARKDKKALWVLLARAFGAGSEAEEIAGTLFWQLKALRLASLAQSASEAGMKEFPFNKARGALKYWKAGELAAASHALLTAYNRGHADTDMDIELERFVLSL